MKKTLIIATALATLISGSAMAQFNQSAPQPSSDGRGVNIPGTTSTGTAVDRPDSNQAQENAEMRRRTIDNSMSNDSVTTGTSSGRMSRDGATR